LFTITIDSSRILGKVKTEMNDIEIPSVIDKISSEKLKNMKQFILIIDRLNAAWNKYKDNTDYEKELRDTYLEYNLLNKDFGRTKEEEKIVNDLYLLWIKERDKKHLSLMIEFFPSNDDFIYDFIVEFLSIRNIFYFWVINKLKNKSINKKQLSKKINHEITNFIFKPIILMVMRLRKSAFVFLRNFLVKKMRRRGYSFYMSHTWITMIYTSIKDDKRFSWSKKIWCYRRGYLPWRIAQYNITENNYLDFMSDRDYCYLHPINNSYTKWINDKVSFRYILDPFKEHIAENYFQIINKPNGKVNVVPLNDCPKEYESSYEGILKLLRNKKDLAFKMASGTHGEGFKKLSYRRGMYFINNEFCHVNDILELLSNVDRYYLITEYIYLHNDLRIIYPESANTVRIMVINENGLDPFIGAAYLRIGSESSGVIDNVGFGGVFAKVDVDTGKYYEGEMLASHIITKSPRHPDTGVLIEGVLPNWNLVKKRIIEICKYIPQLEFMGFDIAITNKGFVIFEINVHQDLHRYPNYSPLVKEYFQRKLAEKIAQHDGKYKRI